MNQPLVSVIIPTYNRGHLIEKAIRSVRAQTYTSWQLIVVDDGSTDDTRQRVEQMDDLEYYYQPNRRQAAARNTGLQHCRGIYVASLDSDDEWYPEFLTNSVAKLEQHQLDFVFSNWKTSRGGMGFDFYFVQPEQQRLYCTTPDGDWWLLNPAQTRHLMIETCQSPSSSTVFRRAIMPKAWNEDMLIGDDWCLLLDIVLNRASRAAFTRIPTWLKHVHDTNIYDCRDEMEVIKELGFHDQKLMAKRFRHLLTPQERGVIRKHRAMQHYNFAYGTLQLSAPLTQVIWHFGMAFRLSPVQISRAFIAWGQASLQKRLGR